MHHQGTPPTLITGYGTLTFTLLCLVENRYASLSDVSVSLSYYTVCLYSYKKHLKNVGPIHHNELPHAHSPDVASGTVARRLRIDVHDNAKDDNNDNA